MSKKQYPNNITKWTRNELVEYREPMAVQFNTLMKVWNRLESKRPTKDDIIKLLQYDYYAEVKSEMTRICDALDWVDTLIKRKRSKEFA